MTAATAPSNLPEQAPSVLVLLVVRGAGILRECLKALSSQTYERFGVLAIDDSTNDGSSEILERALGASRVSRNQEPQGLARSFAKAISSRAARAADYVLLLHDDVVLDPEAITRLVEATRIQGLDDVGVVGAKIVDHDEPRRLRDVGRSSDRFGHPHSPLQADEIDQGQFDRVLEVLAVDSCAVLIARDVWKEVGLFDERLGDDDADVDLGWRVRVRGWRVVMTPLARVRHAAHGDDERSWTEPSRSYREDRAALASVLKNHGFLTLLWVVPVGIVLSVVRLLFLTISRRFEEALDLVGAIGWNIAHLPGTLRRRWRVQRRRKTPDRELRRFTRSAGLHLPTWFTSAERLLDEQRELDARDEGAPGAIRLRHKGANLVTVHPVLVGSFFGIVIGALSVRQVVGQDLLFGAALPVFPSEPAAFFAELVSAYRTTELGGTLSATPALAALGGLSALTLGSTALAQKVVLVGAPILAVILCYRAAVRLTGRPGPSTVAAACYGASAVMLWSFSEGRIGTLLGLVVLPPLVERVEVVFGRDGPADTRARFVVGLAVTIAVGVAFSPGVILAFALVGLVSLAGAPVRGRGLAMSILSLAGAAVLLFPFVPTVVSGGAAALGSSVGDPDPWHVLRLAPGSGPGTWAPAYFLAIAGALGLALARGEWRGRAVRAGIVSASGLALAWLSAAGYLPPAVSNSQIYIGLAAVEMCLLVAYGLASALGGLERASFGFRQIGSALMGVVLVAGLVAQSVAAMTATWAIGGPDKIPAAWAVVDSSARGAFRVLWLGGLDGKRFPAPGGDPSGKIEAGGSSVRFGLTDREGAVMIDTARGLSGPGDDSLRVALEQVLTGSTSNGGALLSPFGIRYVVAEEGVLPGGALEALTGQADLDLVPAAGLLVLRNGASFPPAAMLEPTPEEERLLLTDRPGSLQRLDVDPLGGLSQAPGGWEGGSEGGRAVVVATEFDGAWELEGSSAPPDRSFGWSTSFPVEDANVRIVYGGQLPRTVAVWLLAAVWVAALWITRKPVRR